MNSINLSNQMKAIVLVGNLYVQRVMTSFTHMLLQNKGPS
jgi:hypothetical protein